MKLSHLFIVLVLAFGIFGCAGSGPKACTMEAKLCPDGSAIGRNSSNNCAFDPCPASVLCDATTRCANGECYKFQDLEKPICWQGNPCDRCASGKCSILESYPPQIVCETALPGKIPPVAPSPPATEVPESAPFPLPENNSIKNNLTDCSTEKLPDDCYYRVATARKDVSICSKITALNKRDACYYMVVVQTKDESACGKISDDLVRDQCDHLFSQP